MPLEFFGTVVYALDLGIFLEVFFSRSVVFRLNRLASGQM